MPTADTSFWYKVISSAYQISTNLYFLFCASLAREVRIKLQMQRENIKTIPTFPRFYITHNPLLLSEQGKNVPLSKEMKQNLSDFEITWILCFQTHQYIVDNCPLQDAVCQLATCTAQIMKFFISSIKCSYLVLMQHFPAEFVKSRAMCITRASVVYVLSFPRANVPKACQLLIFFVPTCQCANKRANIPKYQRRANFWTRRTNVPKGVPIFQLFKKFIFFYIPNIFMHNTFYTFCIFEIYT